MKIEKIPNVNDLPFLTITISRNEAFYIYQKLYECDLHSESTVCGDLYRGIQSLINTL